MKKEEKEQNSNLSMKDGLKVMLLTFVFTLVWGVLCFVLFFGILNIDPASKGSIVFIFAGAFASMMIAKAVVGYYSSKK